MHAICSCMDVHGTVVCMSLYCETLTARTKLSVPRTSLIQLGVLRVVRRDLESCRMYTPDHVFTSTRTDDFILGRFLCCYEIQRCVAYSHPHACLCLSAS